MRPTTFRVLCLLVGVAIAMPALALQRGSDPLTGTWTGDWGPNGCRPEYRQCRLEMGWQSSDRSGALH